MCKKRRTIKIRERERERGEEKKERKGEERKLEILKKKTKFTRT